MADEYPKGLADLVANLKINRAYALPTSRGDVPTGEAPYRVPTADVSAGPEMPRANPLDMPPLREEELSRSPKKAKAAPDKRDGPDPRMLRVSEAIVWSPTPIVDWGRSSKMMIPISKTGLTVKPDPFGNLPVALDVSMLQPGDLEWASQSASGGDQSSRIAMEEAMKMLLQKSATGSK